MIGQQRYATLIRALVNRVEGGEEEAATLIRVSRSLLRKAMNGNDPYTLSIADVVALELHVGEAIVTGELAALHERTPGGDLAAATVLTCKEVTDVLAVTHEELSRGVLTPAGRMRVRKELDEAKAALGRIEGALDGHERAHLRVAE